MTKSGPKSVDGKLAVSSNAIRHGILSPRAVIPGVESQADFDSLHARLLSDLNPEGELETQLVGMVVVALWRWARIHRYEASMVGTQVEKAETESARAMVHVEGELRLLREASALLETLSERAATELVPPDVAWTLLEAVSPERAEDVVLSHWGLPGEHRRDSAPSWTVERIRQMIKGGGAYSMRPLDAIRAVAARELQQKIAEREERLATCRREFKSNRSDALLPTPERMMQLARYEAQISKQFYHALHELEACQGRRLGRPVHLARVDVHGLPDAR